MEPGTAPPAPHVEFRGSRELLHHLGILPVRGGRGRSRHEAALEAGAVLRAVGRWRRGRGFRVPVGVLAELPRLGRG